MTEPTEEQETKEQDPQEEKAHLVGIDVPMIPIAVTSFKDLDAMRQAEATVGAMKDDTGAFAEMSENIFLNDEIEDKAAALKVLASEFASRISDTASNPPELKERSFLQAVKKSVKGLLGVEEEQPDETPEAVKPPAGFHVWKDTDTDQYRWLATYSNNIRDDDRPPEIISSKSHKRFVEMVDKGDAPLPELWLWHIPEWKWGQATAVAYDENGFAVATGAVDLNKGAEALAEWYAGRDGDLVSHGMPKVSIIRDKEDPTIIVEHLTREISPLFNWAAANKHTGFSILKEQPMAIPDAKRQAFLDAGINPETLEQLEESNAATAKETDADGLEKKEEGKEPEKAAPAIDAEALVKALDTIEAIDKTVRLLAEKYVELFAEVKALRRTDDEKLKEGMETLPTASLDAYVEGLFNKANAAKPEAAATVAGPETTLTEAQKDPLVFEAWASGGEVQ